MFAAVGVLKSGMPYHLDRKWKVVVMLSCSPLRISCKMVISNLVALVMLMIVGGVTRPSARRYLLICTAEKREGRRACTVLFGTVCRSVGVRWRKGAVQALVFIALRRNVDPHETVARVCVPM
jgi:hypothetical protein